MHRNFDIVVLGLSITSSWGNGHATTWRSLIKGLSARGRRVLFLERDQTQYAANRDVHMLPHCEIRLYSDIEELRQYHAHDVAHAGAVIVGSCVPDGVDICRWVLDTARGVCAFYDIDTPVTLAALARGDCSYLSAELIAGFSIYLSFTSGPVLKQLQSRYRARRTAALYCSVDIEDYRPIESSCEFDLGYMGTYSPDRQAKIESLLVEPAESLPDSRFIVAGAQYPLTVTWPKNVTRTEHLPPCAHRNFYTTQRFTLNVTREDMVASGFAPSVRLFEAAACGAPIISDHWPGIADIFAPHDEILLAERGCDVVHYLVSLPESRRRRIAVAARHRVLTAHSGLRRAQELEMHLANAQLQRLMSTG